MEKRNDDGNEREIRLLLQLLQVIRRGEQGSWLWAAAILAMVKWTLSASDLDIRTEDFGEGVEGKVLIKESSSMIGRVYGLTLTSIDDVPLFLPLLKSLGEDKADPKSSPSIEE